MRRFHRKFSITHQFTLLSLLSLVLTFVILGVSIKRTYDLALEAKQDESRHMSEAAAAIVRGYIAKERSGALSGDEARKQAIETLENMRASNSSYVFVYSFDGFALVLPRPTETHKNRLTAQDPSGKFYVREFVEIGKSGQPGFSNYYATKPGETEFLPKTSFMIGIKDWQWVIGSGAYTDDVKAMLIDSSLRLGAIFVPLLGAFLTTAFMIRRTISDLLSSNDKQRQTLDEERRQKAEMDRRVMEANRVVVDSLGSALSRLSQGDLTTHVAVPYAAEHEAIRANFNSAIKQLHDTIDVIAGNTLSVRAGSVEIASASGDLAQRTERQAVELEQTSVTISQIAATVEETAQAASLAHQIVANAIEDAARGNEVMEGAAFAMGQIEKSAEQISRVVGVIDNITAQTNLLALNATIEAARAGEAGRGFAVVANEVRSLSQRSAIAANDIRGLISLSASQVGVGVTQVAESGKSLDRMRDRIVEINELVTKIAASARDQAKSLADINEAVVNMDKATHENAAMAERSQAASSSLAADMDMLADLVDRFEIGTRSPKRQTRLEPERKQA
ncbi:MAG: methyl-accepting chemotaxis protein [Beijerinckiaceae bacterium]|nr:methyl-accepting chemotaxis protein [Beijerinckiaceae bacterium]